MFITDEIATTWWDPSSLSLVPILAIGLWRVGIEESLAFTFMIYFLLFPGEKSEMMASSMSVQFHVAVHLGAKRFVQVTGPRAHTIISPTPRLPFELAN